MDKLLEPDLYRKITQQVKQLYCIGFNEKIDSQKVVNSDALHLLLEFEKKIDGHLKEINDAEQVEPDKGYIEKQCSTISKRKRKETT